MNKDKLIGMLALLCVIQAIAIFYLSTNETNTHQVSENLTPTNTPEANRATNQSTLPPSPTLTSTALSQQDHESIIRETIREELAYYFAEQNAYLQTNSSFAQVDKKKSKVSSQEDLDAANEKLETLLSQGDLSINSLEELTFYTSKLSVDDRRKITAQLLKAMNSNSPPIVQ